MLLFIAGWWFETLWKILVNWDYYSPIYGKIENVPNHQPDSDVGLAEGTSLGSTESNLYSWIWWDHDLLNIQKALKCRMRTMRLWEILGELNFTNVLGPFLQRLRMLHSKFQSKYSQNFFRPLLGVIFIKPSKPHMACVPTDFYGLPMKSSYV